MFILFVVSQSIVSYSDEKALRISFGVDFFKIKDKYICYLENLVKKAKGVSVFGFGPILLPTLG
jgi:hypothetical protein